MAFYWWICLWLGNFLILLFENSLLVDWCLWFALSPDQVSLKPLVGLPMGNSALQMAIARVPSITDDEYDFHCEYWAIHIQSTRWVNTTLHFWAPLSSRSTVHPLLCIILNLCICPLQGPTYPLAPIFIAL